MPDPRLPGALYFPSELSEVQREGLEFLGEHTEINFRILFSKHQQGNDLGPPGSFRTELERATLYVPELAPNLSESTYRAVSNGSRVAKIWGSWGLTWSGFDRRILADLYGTSRNVIVADPPFSDPIRQEVTQAKRLAKSAPVEVDNDDKALVAICRWGVAEHIREWAILGNLGARMATGQDDDSSLREARVLMTLGAAHTGVFHKLRALGLSPERLFINGSNKFPGLAQLVRREILALTLGPSNTTDRTGLEPK